MFNDAHYLAELVHSICRMTRKPDIVTIVDDGSDEANAKAAHELLPSLKACGIHWQMLRQENAGVFTAINHGISATDAEWVNEFPTDDLVEPDYFNEVDEHQDADVVAVGWEDFGEHSGIARSPDIDLEGLKRGNLICGLSPFKKALWERIGGFDPSLSPISDYAFWLDAALAGARFHSSKRTLVKVRVRSNSLWHQQRDKDITMRSIMFERRGLRVHA